MYSTCLYCSRDLGANTVIETLPIGRRIAFDESTGRLWVVCRGCEKWNLVPFDSRLETIEACEILFRDAKLKFSTDNIGIARLPEGLTLVRVGRAERQEFAAWRYGDQFGRRRVKNWALGAGLLAATGATLVLHRQLGMVPLVGPLIPSSLGHVRNLYRRRRATPRIGGNDGGVTTRHQIWQSTFGYDDDGKLRLHVNVFERARAGFAVGLTTRSVAIGGADVIPALGMLLPHINHGGSAKSIRQATDLITSDPQIESLASHIPESGTWGFNSAGALGTPSSGQPTWAARWFPEFHAPEPVIGPQQVHSLDYRVAKIPQTARLALEMVAHEETERAALAGELKLLERQWKEADRVAKIADDLVLDAG